MMRKERMAEKKVFKRGIRYAQYVVRGYMCKVDFDHELGHSMGGSTVYPSVKDLKKHRKCVTGNDAPCGIVEVEVRVRRIVRDDRW
jgi:hypothetical protein